MTLDLNDLLRKAGVDPYSSNERVLVARHSSPNPRIAAELRASAAGDRSFFEGYQRTQRNPTNEARFLEARVLVSCVAHHPDTAVLAGVYRIEASHPLTTAEYWSQPFAARLLALDPNAQSSTVREGIRAFDMERLFDFDQFVDRLELRFHNPISWLRWAAQNTFPIAALHAEPVLAPPLPQWNEICLSQEEILTLPPSWRAAIAQWRGIYCITDNSDGRSYVGSAYGAENILGRWMNYVASGDGGNVGLRRRDPAGFRFSILQVVAPDMAAQEVIALEHRWMDRLQTRISGLNAGSVIGNVSPRLTPAFPSADATRASVPGR